MSGEESDKSDNDDANETAPHQQMEELEEKTKKLKVDPEEEEYKKEELELRRMLEETPFFKLAIPGPIGTVAEHCKDKELINLAATCKRIRHSLNRECIRFKRMNTKIDLEEIGIQASNESLIDLNRALPELKKLKLGIIKTSQVMKYLKNFKELRQLEMTVKRNHYFSGDRINVDYLKLRNDGGTNKNIVQLLSNFRELKSLSLYNFKLTPDILQAIYQHRKSLINLALINCNERLKPIDDLYLFNLTRLKKLKIINLFCRNITGSFESRYVKRMPHQLQTFEFDRVFPHYQSQNMRSIENIKILYDARHLESEEDRLLEFIEDMKDKPLTLILKDNRMNENEKIQIENFMEVVRTINPLISQKIAKNKV